MELLILLLLLSPIIFAHRHKIDDPNNEPFLPIYPIYPYSPKLIKRDAERELIPQLMSELYAPKVDAKDSYSATYNSNYQRDPYYTNYNPYPRNIPPTSNYPTYYSGEPYAAYANSPYAAYNSYPYALNPASYPTSSYPNYYYQPSYYYPHYFNPAPFPPPPPPPPPQSPQPSSSPADIDYHESPQQDSETEDDGKQGEDKRSKKPKEDETNQDPSASQFVDGGNYISANSRDLDGQSSTYKTASPYNQLQREVQLKTLSIPLPKTTYRVISVAGRPVGPDYPLPPAYVKAQQMEQLTSQTLAKLLGQKQVDQLPYENGKESGNVANGGSYANQNAYNPHVQSYVTSLPDARGKTAAAAYVISTSDGTSKANAEETNNPQAVLQSQAVSSKSARYPSVVYVQKSVAQVIPSRPQGTYVSSADNRGKQRDRVTVDSRPADQTDEYGDYHASSPQSYGGATSQSQSKQEPNYESYRSQTSSYQSKGFIGAASQTPRSYTYEYSAYEPDQATEQQSHSQSDNINPDDGDFGAKQYNKG